MTAFKRRWSLCFLLLILSQALYAQKDTLFWFAAPEVYRYSTIHNLDRDIVFRITTYEEAADVIISQPAGSMYVTLSIAANSTYTYNLTSNINNIESRPPNTVLNKGLKIESDANISVYYEVITGGTSGGNNPEAFTLKGRNALGQEFYIPGQNLVDNHPDYHDSNFNSIDIIATEDDTEVTIRLTNDIIGYSAADGPFTIMLDAGQVYSAQAVSGLAGDHLDGSYITSNKPIAITVKDDLLDGGTTHTGNCADLTGDQIVPIHIIGTEYIAINGVLFEPYDYVFITATEDNTEIFKDGSTIPLTTIDEGETYQISFGDEHAMHLSTGYPSYAWQLSGSGCEFGASILPPIECTGSNQTSYVRSSTYDLKFNLLVTGGSEADFLINGTALSSSYFDDVPGTSGDWKFAQLDMPLSSYPFLGIIKVENTTGIFHLSTIDINPGGTSYGYFSNYGQISIVDTIAEICEGASFTFYGTEYNTTGTYYYTDETGNCDTIKELILTVHPKYRTTDTFEICSSQLPASYMGFDIPAGATTTSHFDSLLYTSSYGCDSLLVLNLIIHDSSSNTIDTFICANESVIIDGELISEEGQYSFAYININGCDSMVYVNVEIGDTTSSVLDTVLCANTELNIGGFIITESGYYTVSFINAENCDSSVYISASFQPGLIVKDTLVSGCNLVLYEGTEYTSSTTIRDTLRGYIGCDSFIFNQYIHIEDDVKDTIYVDICTGENYLFGEQYYTESTIVTENFPQTSGCDSFVTLMLTVHASPDVKLIYEMMDLDMEHCVFDTIVLYGTGALEYYYFDGAGDKIGEGDSIKAALTSLNNHFLLIGYNEFNCSDTASINILAYPCCDLLIPSAFSPNGDGLNDGFGPVTYGNFLNYKFQIFNRWGELVYVSFDSRDKWDGKYKNKNADAGIYFYILTGMCQDGSEIKFKGDMTLIR